MAFHLPGNDLEVGQFPQECAALLETELGSGDPDHARDRGRQRRAIQGKGAVTRAEAVPAGRAMIPRPLQGQGAKCRGEGPGPPPDIAGVGATGARQLRSLPVRQVGVQPRGNQRGRGRDRGLANLALQDLEIQPVDRGAGQALDVLRDFRRDRPCEVPPFSGLSPRVSRPSARTASASASLASR